MSHNLISSFDYQVAEKAIIIALEVSALVVLWNEIVFLAFFHTSNLLEPWRLKSCYFCSCVDGLRIIQLIEQLHLDAHHACGNKLTGKYLSKLPAIERSISNVLIYQRHWRISFCSIDSTNHHYIIVLVLELEQQLSDDVWWHGVVIINEQSVFATTLP